MVDVAPPPDECTDGFPAESQLWLLAGMAIGRVSAPGLRTIRTSTHIRRDPTDHWVLTIGLGATTQVACNGDVHSVPIRVPFVTSLAETCESVRGRDDRLHLYIARDRFVALSRILDRVRGPLVGPLGMLLADYLELLVRALPRLSEADLLKISGAVSTMLASCIDASVLQEGSAATQIGHTLRERVRQVVRSRLQSSSLGPASICRAVGISRSGLYRLMQGEGGVARYIQSQRLQACYAALCDLENTQTINAIAEAHGFPDPSSFNRAFRQRYSLTPGDVRAAAQAEVVLVTAGNASPTEDLVTMRDYLRSL